MHWKEWLKAALVTAGGGALSAISTMILDPTKFNLSNGLKDEALITLQGAAVALIALIIRSPLGTYLLGTVQQSKQDQALLEQTKKQVKEPPK
jgi:hypothetical protein